MMDVFNGMYVGKMYYNTAIFVPTECHDARIDG